MWYTSKWYKIHTSVDSITGAVMIKYYSGDSKTTPGFDTSFTGRG